MIEPAPGGFYGLNLHYLNPRVRAKFLDELMKTAPKKITDKSKIRARYNLLASSKKYKEFKPCFKHYLTDHVRSKFAIVPAPEWEIATFLPMADWQKGTGSKVYADSRNMIK